MGKMVVRLGLAALLVACAVMARAETIVLRSGDGPVGTADGAITLLRGRSNDLELPGGIKANLLITETVGDGPFGEGILESVADARARLLVPGARIIPAAITVGVVPLCLPQDLLERYIFTLINKQRGNKIVWS